MYVKNNNITLENKADIYDIKPKELLAYILNWLGKMKNFEDSDTVKLFLSNMNKLQDLVQAKMLQGLDKGLNVYVFVDISFTFVLNLMTFRSLL